MPGKVKCRVVAGRSLPVMDRSNDTTDAYVEVKLGQVTYKTDVCRKSLNPQWNSEWFKFEMDDLELQDEPLQIRLMDYDTYSANDAIGKVYLDLNPLLINSAKTKDNWGKTISGWLPVYDTMHGLRGEVNLIVKVELFSDLNKYRQSSCGVRFFFSPHVPEGFVAHSINGFVEELVINDDPEYQWIDKIRTPRASNEARQTLFQKLSGEVQRKVGLKTLELGGNAVVGYKQCIDLEGESGLVIRGIGTAMYLTKLSENQLSPVPLGSSTDGTSKEFSHSLMLSCQQPHSLPRKRKPQRVPNPANLQHQSSKHHPQPSMPNPASLPCVPSMSTKASHDHDPTRSRLSSSFSNLLIRKTIRRSASPNPPQDQDLIPRGRSASPPPTQKLKSTASASSLLHLTTLEKISHNTKFSQSKASSNDNTPRTMMTSRDDSERNYVQKGKNPKSFSSQPAQKSQLTKEFKGKDKKDGRCASVTNKDNFYDHDMRNYNPNIKTPHKSCNSEMLNRTSTTNTNTSMSYTHLSDKYLLAEEIEPDLELDLELVASGGETLSEISEERESQESLRVGSSAATVAPSGRWFRPTPSPQPPVGAGSDKPRPRPLSLSEKESDECSISEDSPPTSPTSTTSSVTNKFTLLNLRKKHRWVTRRERLSTNCLVKRASSNAADASSASSPPGSRSGGGPIKQVSSSSNSSSTTKIRRELGKIFKRISFSADGDSDTNNSNRTEAKKTSPTKPGPYRAPRKLFFRRRRTRSRGSRPPVSVVSVSAGHRGSIVRSNSECGSQSFSLRQTSSESLPSVGSEPPVVFKLHDDDEDDDNFSLDHHSLQEMPTYENNTATVADQEADTSNKPGTPVKESAKVQLKEGVQPAPTSVPVNYSKLRELIGDLGYDTGKPLKLYISSMDALLVYDPDPAYHPASVAASTSGAVNISSSCVCLKNVVDNTSSCHVSGANNPNPALNRLDIGHDLDLDSFDLTPKIREKVDTLLNLRRADSSVLDLEERFSNPTGQKEELIKRRHRTETLVECNSSTSSNSSSSMNTSGSGSGGLGGTSATTTSSESGGCTTSATSSCTKAFSSVGRRLRRSDDERVDMEDEDAEKSFEKLKNFVKSAQKGNGSAGVISSSGCRSPIPEEFVESSSTTGKVNNSSAQPTTTTSSNSNAIVSSSPPKRVGSPQKPIPSGSNVSGNVNGFYGDQQESKSSGQMSNGNSSGSGGECGQCGSPEKSSRTTTMTSSTPINKGHYGQMHRRSSESDLSTTPKGTSGFSKAQFQRPVTINVDPIRGQEFPFITLSSQFPEGFILYLGGTVTARSVKLLKSIGNFEEPSPEHRDSWWNELRIEMRSHCRAFGCNVLLDYEEKTTMWDEVAILSASGTAAIINTTTNVSGGGESSEGEGVGSNVNKDHKRNDSFTGVVQLNPANGAKSSPKTSRGRHDSDGSDLPCSMLHIPQASLSLPTIVKKTRCAFCRKGKVPDVLLASIDLPPGLHTTGRSCLIQTQVFRSKKESKGEVGAKEMSDSIPFLEYELHRRLINKLKVKGMNAIFGYKVQITQGDKVVIGVCTGTAVFCTALPVPTLPIICAGNLKTDSQKVAQFQKVIQETFEKNREIFGVKNIVIPNDWASGVGVGGDSDGESDDDLGEENETKDTFVLEVDDAEDIDIITMLIDPAIPVGHNMSNIETIVGFEHRRVVSQQMFNQAWRCKIPTISQRQLTTYFERLIRLVSFKLRRLQPCVFARMLWTIDLPESDELQLSVIGMALGLDTKIGQLPVTNTTGKSVPPEVVKQEEDPDIMFQFDEDKLTASVESSGDFAADQRTEHIGTPPSSTGIAIPQKSTNKSSICPGPGANISLNVSHGHGNSSSTSFLTNNISVSFQQSNNEPTSSSSGGCITLNTNSPWSDSSTTSSFVSNTNNEGRVGGGGEDGPEVGRNRSHSLVFCTRHPNTNSKSSRSISFVKPMPLPVSKMRHWVEISPLSVIPGAKIERYLGNLNFYFIRETSSLRESGGVNTFVHTLFTDFLAIVRAHVSALGGNAIVSYFMTRCDLSHNPHKNQGQCVINVGGDAVFVTYPIGNHPEDGISVIG